MNIFMSLVIRFNTTTNNTKYENLNILVEDFTWFKYCSEFMVAYAFE